MKTLPVVLSVTVAVMTPPSLLHVALTVSALVSSYPTLNVLSPFASMNSPGYSVADPSASDAELLSPLAAPAVLESADSPPPPQADRDSMSAAASVAAAVMEVGFARMWAPTCIGAQVY